MRGPHCSTKTSGCDAPAQGSWRHELNMTGGGERAGVKVRSSRSVERQCRVLKPALWLLLCGAAGTCLIFSFSVLI